MSYATFLQEKSQSDFRSGFKPVWMLDVIDRCLVLWSNPSETVLTPFMGVGSEIYGAVCAGRKGIGMELKPSYYRQAQKNLDHALKHGMSNEQNLLAIEA